MGGRSIEGGRGLSARLPSCGMRCRPLVQDALLLEQRCHPTVRFKASARSGQTETFRSGGLEVSQDTQQARGKVTDEERLQHEDEQILERIGDSDLLLKLVDHSRAPENPEQLDLR